jgi:hypothetical protein
VKLNLNLSLIAKPVQRCAQPGKPETQLMKSHDATALAGTPRRGSSFDWLTRRAHRSVRIPAPIIAARPVFRGDKSYLRALRAAEMAIWNANRKFPVTIALLFAVVHAGAR